MCAGDGCRGRGSTSRRRTRTGRGSGRSSGAIEAAGLAQAQATPTGTAFAANVALGTALWRRDGRVWPAFAAAALILSTLAIFFAWTFPANQATQNWTVMPEDWEPLRRQWEHSHAVNAVLTFLALCFVAGRGR